MNSGPLGHRIPGAKNSECDLKSGQVPGGFMDLSSQRAEYGWGEPNRGPLKSRIQGRVVLDIQPFRIKENNGHSV